MRTRRVTCALALVTTLALSGCTQAQDAVRDKANSVASSAASRAAEATKDLARQQLCKVTADGKISASESASLDAAVDAAERAGVPKDVTDAARRLTDEGTSAPRKAVADLKQACAAA